MTETYTRDSDGKRFKKIIIGKGFSDETEICYLERIEENPMPELPRDLEKQIDAIFGFEPSYHKTTMRCFAQALLRTIWEAKK